MLGRFFKGAGHRCHVIEGVTVMAMGGARVLRRLVRVRDRVVVVERAERRLGVHEVDVV